MAVRLTYDDDASFRKVWKYYDKKTTSKNYSKTFRLSNYTVVTCNRKLRVYRNDQLHKFLYEADFDFNPFENTQELMDNMFIYKDSKDAVYHVVVVTSSAITVHPIIGLRSNIELCTYYGFGICEFDEMSCNREYAKYIAVFTKVTIGDTVNYAFTKISCVNINGFSGAYTRSLITSKYELVAYVKDATLFLYKSKGYRELTLASENQLMAVSCFDPKTPNEVVDFEHHMIFDPFRTTIPSATLPNVRHYPAVLYRSYFTGRETILINLQGTTSITRNPRILDRVDMDLVDDDVNVMVQYDAETLIPLNSVLNAALDIFAFNGKRCISSFYRPLCVHTRKESDSVAKYERLSDNIITLSSALNKIYFTSGEYQTVVLELTIPT
jgi:hypothetical protein